jgi:hypothetical protein
LKYDICVCIFEAYRCFYLLIGLWPVYGASVGLFSWFGVSVGLSIIIWYDAFLPIIVEYILTLLGIGDSSKRSTHSVV